jgi:hypothetical protein
VALNPSISSGGFEHLGRIVGKLSGNEYVSGSGEQSNNHAWTGMALSIAGESMVPGNTAHNGRDGADLATDKPGADFYKSLGWNFNAVWKMGAEGYPVHRWAE